MINFLVKVFNTNSHQIKVLESVIEEQTKMLNELRDTLHKQLENNRDLKLLIKSMQDKQDGNTRPSDKYKENLDMRSRQLEADRAYMNAKEDLYNWRMNK